MASSVVGGRQQRAASSEQAGTNRQGHGRNRHNRQAKWTGTSKLAVVSGWVVVIRRVRLGSGQYEQGRSRHGSSGQAAAGMRLGWQCPAGRLSGSHMARNVAVGRQQWTGTSRQATGS